MPQKRNPLIPMGAITGRPTKEETDRLLEFYHSVGIEQYLIYPRSGCELEYLSEEWFEVCGNIIRKAAELDMKIFLYDDFNWPSAQIDGKLVLDHPEFAQKQLLITHTENGTEFEIYDTAKRLEVDEIRNSDQELRVDSNKHQFPKTDLLNPAVTEEFIRRTHEEYYKRFAEYFGSTIVAIFTDEPTYTYTCDIPNIPYYDDAPAEYAALYGKDLFEDLAQTTDATRPDFYDRYYTMLGKRFRKAFFNVISDWCTAHGILSTGHLLHEEDAQNRINGDNLHTLCGLTLPGMDEIPTNVLYDTAELLTLATVEYASRKRGGAMAELYALGAADMNHAVIRKMMAMTALHGVDHYVLAVAAFDARGNYYKDGYYNPQGPAQPWAEAYRLMGEEAKLLAEYARKEPIPQVQFVYPVSLGHRHIGEKDGPLRQKIKDLLRAVEKAQWNVALVAEEETPSAPAVIRMTEEGFCLNGGEALPAEAIPAELEKILSRAAVLKDAEGNVLPEIMLRSYPDGFAAVDMRETGDVLDVLVHWNGTVTPIRLVPRGVVCDRTLVADQPTKQEFTLNDISFRLTLDRPNLMRAFAEPEGFAFRAETELHDVRLVSRWYKTEEERVLLDGQELTQDVTADVPLMGVFKPLYNVSESVTLSAGKHRITYVGGAEERRFLPLAFLSGAFSLKDGVIDALPENVSLGDLGEFLQDYTGKLTLQTEIAVPDMEGDLYLNLDSYGLYTRVTLGDRCAERVWEPFAYPIPECAKGKTVPLTVELFTSVRPMFDNPADHPDLYNQRNWIRDRYVPGTHTPVGIRSLSIVRK